MDRVEVIDARGNLHLYTPDVIRALAAVGLIWRLGETWRMNNPDTVDLGLFPELARCDFCDERPVAWNATAEMFIVGRVGDRNVRSTLDWMACEPCGALIAANDRAGLARRSFAFVAGRLPAGLSPGPFVDQQRLLLTLFWQHYRGIARLTHPLP